MAPTNDDQRPTLEDLEYRADADCEDYFLFLTAWANARRCY